MEYALDKRERFNRKQYFALLLVEFLILFLALILPPEKALLLALGLGGAVLIFLLPVYPLILFPLMVVTSALDVSGQILPDTRLFTTFNTPITGFHLVGSAAILFTLAKLFFEKRTRLPRLELTIPLVFYLTVLGISVVYSPNKLEGMTHFIRMSFLALLIFVTVFLVETRRAVTLVIASVVICGVVSAGWGIFQALTQRYFLPASFVRAAGASIPRASASFYNPNSLGTFLMLATLLPVALLVNLRLSRRAKVALLAAIAILLGGLLTTFSRSNWLATGFGIICIAWLSRKLRSIFVLFLVLLIIIAVAAIISPNYADLVLGRFTSIFATFSEYKSVARVSSVSRLHFIKGAYSMFLDHPLTGIGVRGFPVLFEKYKPVDFPIWIPTRESHTYLATVLAELGIVGFAAALWFAFVVLLAGIRAVREIDDPYLKAIMIGLVSVFVGFHVSMFFTADIGNNFFWLMIGMLFAVRRIGQNLEEQA
ncbi:MAG TPA: hypothetical protein EYP53_06840 [Candidatus Latescibacteria bacterium]|nr:hypothetical protein [Candidatus Latescibacterota bacterium]